MKLRQVGVGLALVGASLSACSETAVSGEATPESSVQTFAQTGSDIRFLADGNASDAFEVVNCINNPADTASFILPLPQDEASVLFTMGVTVEGTNAKRTARTRYLIGGVTLRALPGNTVEFITSAQPAGTGQTIKPLENPYKTVLTFPGYDVGITIGETDIVPGFPAVTATCNPQNPTAPSNA